MTVDISSWRKPQNANHRASLRFGASDDVAIVTLAIRQELAVAVTMND